MLWYVFGRVLSTHDFHLASLLLKLLHSARDLIVGDLGAPLPQKQMRTTCWKQDGDKLVFDKDLLDCLGPTYTHEPKKLVSRILKGYKAGELSSSLMSSTSVTSDAVCRPDTRQVRCWDHRDKIEGAVPWYEPFLLSSRNRVMLTL